MRTEDTGEASFSELGDSLDRLAPDLGWPDLVVPEDQAEAIRKICAAFRDRSRRHPGARAVGTNGRSNALIVLFVGEPGTGKTTATRVVGSELNLGILRLDLRRLSSGDPEGIEGALEHALATARESGEILLLDDAETVFGKRQPAERERSRAQVPVDALARRLDGHSGLIVLAAQLKARLDDQLVERVDHEVEFPFPQADAREHIWRLRLPANRRIDDAQFAFLGASFKLSGGVIDRCTTFAAEEAAAAGVPVDLRHVVLALEREYGGRLTAVQTRDAIARARELIVSDEVSAAGPTVEHKPMVEPEPAVEPTVDPKVIRWPDRTTQVEPVPQPEPGPRRKPAMTVTPAPPRRPARKAAPGPAAANRRLALLALGGVIVAALLGFLLARGLAGSGSSAPSLNQRAAVGSLTVSYPTGWRRETPPAVPALGLTDELALAPSGQPAGLLVVGRAATAGPSVLLPPGLLSGTGNLGRAQLITLDGAHYYRYLDQAVRGLTGPASLYVLPAGAGTIFGLCEKQGSQSAFAATCERIVGTVRPTSGGLLRVSLSAGYVSALTAAMAKFSAARATAGASLARARTPKAQAAAAAALAAAHFQAAAAVTGLSAGGARTANLALAMALRQTGDAYKSLGGAAGRNDARGYAAARSTVAAALTQLGAAFTQLGKVGYVAG